MIVGPTLIGGTVQQTGSPLFRRQPSGSAQATFDCLDTGPGSRISSLAGCLAREGKVRSAVDADEPTAATVRRPVVAPAQATAATALSGRAVMLVR